MKRYLVFALLMLIPLIACSVEEAKPLVFAVIPADDPSATRDKYAPMIEYLSEGLGRQVELRVASDYSAVVEAAKYGHADFVRISSNGYVNAVDQGATIEPIVTAIKATTGKPGYYALIVARADSGLAGLTDIEGRDFAFVDVGSTSGYLVPSYALSEHDVTVGKAFMAGSHEAAILAVKNGTVSAAATADNRFALALGDGVIEEGELVVLYQSPLVPNVPIAVQQSMDKAVKAKLQQLFLEMPEEIVVHCGIKESGYVLAQDSDYDFIRELVAYTSK